MDNISLDRRMAAELIGTFGFFFIGFMGVAAGITQRGSIDALGKALGFGIALGAMIFIFGHVSGGHFNPAVTFGLACGGRFPWREVPGYWAAQAVGGLAAAGVVRSLFTDKVGDALVSAPGRTVVDGRALIIEIIATAFLVMVVSSVATDDVAPWHGVLAPVAIGGYIVVAATAIGPSTSGSFNPARSIGPALVAGEFGDLWIFLVGPLVGGVVGGLLFTFIRAPGPLIPTGADWRERQEFEPDVEAPHAHAAGKGAQVHDTEYERESEISHRDQRN